MNHVGGRIWLLIPALALGALSGLLISLRWIPIWTGVGAAIAVGIVSGLLVFRPWRRKKIKDTNGDAAA